MWIFSKVMLILL